MVFINKRIAVKCMLYRTHKRKFEFENYLISIPQYYDKYIIKFKTSNHKLSVERWTYTNIIRTKMHCDLCESGRLGDEFHLLLELRNNDVCEVRRRFIPLYYTQSPSVHKYTELMCATAKK